MHVDRLCGKVVFWKAGESLDQSRIVERVCNATGGVSESSMDLRVDGGHTDGWFTAMRMSRHMIFPMYQLAALASVQAQGVESIIHRLLL